MSTAAKLALEKTSSPPKEQRKGGGHPSTHYRQALCVFCLILADILAILISLSMAIFVRTRLLPLVDTHVTNLKLPLEHYLDFAWVWVLLLLLLGFEGLYTQRRTIWNEISHLIKAIALGSMVIFATIGLAQRGPLLSRLTIMLTAAILLVILPTVRCCAKWMLRAIGLWRKRILILGATDTAKLAIRGLASDPVMGYELSGLLDNDPQLRGTCFATCRDKPIFVLGSLAEAPEHMDKTGSRDVLIAMPDLGDEKLLDLVHELQRHCESIYVVPQLWGLSMMNLRLDGFLRERLMMLKLSNSLAKPWNCGLKRAFDIVFSSLIMLLALPLCLIVSALIKIDSDGPLLFVQERLGHNGRNFRCIKFRTMHVKCEEILTRHLANDPTAAEEWRRYAKLREYDPRLTRLGGFLRRWSLDELPQLWNVLKGDMSLVGPRPYLPQEYGRIGTELFTILSSRPGMTGFWQVNGRNLLTLEDRVQLEAWYVRNWTVWFDCIILAKTFRAVLFPRNCRDFENEELFESSSQKDLILP